MANSPINTSYRSPDCKVDLPDSKRFFPTNVIMRTVSDGKGPVARLDSLLQEGCLKDIIPRRAHSSEDSKSRKIKPLPLVRSDRNCGKGRRALIGLRPLNLLQTLSSEDRETPSQRNLTSTDRARSDGIPCRSTKRARITFIPSPLAMIGHQLQPLTRSTSGVLRETLHERLTACRNRLKEGSYATLRKDLMFMKNLIDEFLKSSEEKFKLAPDETKGALHEQTQSQSKLRTKDLVHELRAPLNNIGGYLDLLDSDLSREERADAISGLSESFKHLGEVLKNDITDSSEIDLRLIQEEFTVNQIFQRVGSNTKMTDPNVKIEFKFLGDDLDKNTPLNGDFLKICKVLINLTNNAIKYSEKPGNVLVQIQVWKKEDGKMTLRFFVRDKGPGMSQKFMQESLFKQFSKGEKAVTSSQNASGLGLYLSQAFLSVMGSKIQVASNEPKVELDAQGQKVKKNIGTVFYFELEVPVQAPTPVLPTQGPLQGRKILVVEDDKGTAKLYRAHFSKVGAPPILANSGEDAVELFENDSSFDAVISDQNFEGKLLKGLDVAEKIQQIAQRKGIAPPPFILCSGDDFKEEELNALKGADFHVFAKPIPFKKIIQTVIDRVEARKS